MILSLELNIQILSDFFSTDPFASMHAVTGWDGMAPAPLQNLRMAHQSVYAIRNSGGLSWPPDRQTDRQTQSVGPSGSQLVPFYCIVSLSLYLLEGRARGGEKELSLSIVCLLPSRAVHAYSDRLVHSMQMQGGP